MAGDFCILHLSDIHIRSIDDPIITLSREIAKTAFHDARDTGVCLILVSGDIAFSGSADEYEAAKLFLRNMRDAIENEGCKYVDIIVVPGNHDCNLLPNDSTRNIVIDHIVKTSHVDLASNVVENCTKVQSEFFKFRASITSAEPSSDHQLWTEYEFNIEGNTLRLSALNAAWMSRNPEINGELVFPIDQFQPQLNVECSMRIAMIHHPLHWYNETSFHALREYLHMHCDLLLSGHEHTQTTIQSEVVAKGQCAIFEGGALQPHENTHQPEFSIIRFVEMENKLIQSCFFISDFTRVEEPVVTELMIPTGGDRGAAAQLTDNFQKLLRDPGGNFIHPVKANLTLDDIFIFPIVTDRMRPGERDISTTELIKYDDKRKRILFIGDEKAGKTTLIRQVYREWHIQGNLPIYIKGSQLKTKKEENFRRVMAAAAKIQYVDPSFFENAPIEKRMILIDDIDLLSGGHAALRPLIDYCDKHFCRIFVTATTGYEFTELLKEESAEALSSFEVFTIPTFGHKVRRRLIRKWCASAGNKDEKEIERSVHQIETVMNTVIGNNLIPAQPIFLLILLQSIDQRQEQDLHHSSFAYYYQYLITKGLGSAGIHPEEIDEIFNYLTNLAWLLQSIGVIELSAKEFRDFNQRFSEKFVSVDLTDRLNVLTRAKVLIKSNEQFSFAYPYIRYFFIGKYLAENSDDQEVSQLIQKYCESLHIRSRANCIMFLMHHRNDLSIVDKISHELEQAFSEHAPLDIGEDTRSLNALIDSSTELLLGEVDVEANQEKERELRDRYDRTASDEEETSVDQTIDAAMDVSIKINSVIKTAEILGQVLKNYYGSIERTKKAALMANIFNGPLRMLRFLIEDVIDDPENFAQELHKLIRMNKPAMAEMPSEKATRRFAFNLIGTICTGIVVKIAKLVNSEKLEEDLEKLVTDSDSVSYRLIAAAVKLTQPGRVAISDIQALGKDVRDNHFAFEMLQSLGYYHLRMFHTDEIEKQKLCAALRIGRKAADTIKGPSGRRKLPLPEKK